MSTTTTTTTTMTPVVCRYPKCSNEAHRIAVDPFTEENPLDLCPIHVVRDNVQRILMVQSDFAARGGLFGSSRLCYRDPLISGVDSLEKDTLQVSTHKKLKNRMRFIKSFLFNIIIEYQRLFDDASWGTDEQRRVMSRALRLFDNWRKEVGFTPGAENEEELGEIRERMIGELKDVLSELCKEENIAQDESNQEDSQATSPLSPPPTPRTPSPSPSSTTTIKSSLKRKRDESPPEPRKRVAFDEKARISPDSLTFYHGPFDRIVHTCEMSAVPAQCHLNLKVMEGEKQEKLNDHKEPRYLLDFRRKSKSYQPGQWKSEPGYEKLDTSGLDQSDVGFEQNHLRMELDYQMQVRAVKTLGKLGSRWKRRCLRDKKKSS